MLAPACSTSVRTRRALCAAKLSRMTISPRRRRGTSRRWTHSINRVVVIAPPRGTHRQPPIHAHRADRRQVIAPVSRARLDQHTAPGTHGARAPSPDSRPIRREIPAAHIDAAKPVPEGAPVGLDYRSVLLGRPRAFFLKTYPVRCNARNTLDRWTCASRAARWVYARVSSSVMRSGRSLIRACSSWMLTGEHQPPPRGAGSTVPRSRAPWTQRTNV